MNDSTTKRRPIDATIGAIVFSLLGIACIVTAWASMPQGSFIGGIAIIDGGIFLAVATFCAGVRE